MDPADEALIEAWKLADDNYTDELSARFDELLPALVEAGYAHREGNTWHFTRKGFARANELSADEW